MAGSDSLSAPSMGPSPVLPVLVLAASGGLASHPSGAGTLGRARLCGKGWSVPTRNVRGPEQLLLLVVTWCFLLLEEVTAPSVPWATTRRANPHISQARWFASSQRIARRGTASHPAGLGVAWAAFPGPRPSAEPQRSPVWPLPRAARVGRAHPMPGLLRRRAVRDADVLQGPQACCPRGPLRPPCPLPVSLSTHVQRPEPRQRRLPPRPHPSLWTALWCASLGCPGTVRPSCP